MGENNFADNKTLGQNIFGVTIFEVLKHLLGKTKVWSKPFIGSKYCLGQRKLAVKAYKMIYYPGVKFVGMGRKRFG